MAHDSDGRIYVDPSTTGVCIADLQAVLGRGTGDLGLLCSDQEWNEDGTELLPVNKINKWPKFKPVRSSLLKVMTLADMQDVYFGLDVPIYGSGYITSISGFLDAFASSYAYLRPRGADRTPKEWFRLRDFDGYDNRAVPFASASGSTFPTTYRYGESGGGINFILALNSGTGLYGGISVSDWKLGGSEGTPFSSLYFGLLFVHGTDAPKIITASSVLSGNGLTVHINEPSNQGLDGLNTSYTYTVYPILCSAAHTSMGSIGNTDILVAIPLPPFSFKQIPVSAQLTLTIANETATLDYRLRLRVQADLGFLTTGGHSSIAINATLYRASYNGDESGSQIEQTGTYSFYGVTTSSPAHLDTGKLATMANPPTWVRVHAVAPNQAGVQADFYILVTEEML